MLARVGLGVVRIRGSRRRAADPHVRRIAPSVAVSARPFVAGTRSYSARHDLSHHLRELVVEEKAPTEEMNELDTLMAANGWKLKFEDDLVILSKSHTEGEEVTVRVFTDEDMEGEDHAAHDHEHEHEHNEGAKEEASGPMAGQNDRFEIVISQGRSTRVLRFDCKAKDGVIFIQRVGVTSAKEDAEGKADVLAVMSFDELPEETASLLESYLMERSINNDLARIVFLALNKADTRTFVNWMEHVEAFLH